MTILPDLTPDQAREVATIRDAAGLGQGRDRPFRAPHHSITPAGLVGGGGSPVQPGEITLAHHGILFLSDLPEFSRPTLEALRAPVDDRQVTAVRGTHSVCFPADVQLVASASPCPCGDADRCSCEAETLARYQRRLSAARLDRFAIVVDLPSATDPHAQHLGPSSAELRDRVCAARERRSHAAVTSNGSGSLTRSSASLEPVVSDAAWAALYDAYRAGSMTHRSGGRVLAVAQTVADLAAEDVITVESLNTALALSGRPSAGAPNLAC